MFFDFVRLLEKSQFDYSKLTPYRLMAYSYIGSLCNYQTIKFFADYAAFTAFSPSFPINSDTSDDLIEAMAASKAANENPPP